MGEYAKYKGESVKIGTCADMYYLRADQRHLVKHEPGNVNAAGEDAAALRFRFPFPGEDEIEPGCFEDPFRGVDAPAGFSLPEGFEHRDGVQFTNRGSAGGSYLATLPCPESIEWPASVRKARNGIAAAFQVTAQRLIDGELWTVIRCNGCGAMSRLPKVDGLALSIAYLEAARDERGESRRDFFAEMGRRIAAGYETEAPEIVESCDGLNLHAYAARVAELEAEGLTTSDAQGIADIEFEAGKGAA